MIAFMAKAKSTGLTPGRAAGIGPKNPVTGRRRIPWRDLDAAARRKRYAQALRARRAGLPGEDPGTFEDFAARQERLDDAQC